MRARRLNGGADGRLFVDGEIVEDDDVAAAERGREHLLDVGQEDGLSIGPLKTAGGAHAVQK